MKSSITDCVQSTYRYRLWALFTRFVRVIWLDNIGISGKSSNRHYKYLPPYCAGKGLNVEDSFYPLRIEDIYRIAYTIIFQTANKQGPVAILRRQVNIVSYRYDSLCSFLLEPL